MQKKKKKQKHADRRTDKYTNSVPKLSRRRVIVPQQ